MSEEVCCSFNIITVSLFAESSLRAVCRLFFDFSSKMNRIALIFAVGFCFAVGQDLQCYKCKIGIFNMCFTTKVTCATGEDCFSGEGGTGELKIKMKGCLQMSDCNKTENVNFPTNSTTLYSMTKTCCSTDLCNAAPGLPGASGLSLAVVTIFSFLAASLMV